MLANLAPHKGQETAVRAVAILKSRGRHVSLWLAGIERQGNTSFTRRLEQLIQELGVADRVRLLGQRGDAPELLRAADIFLLPSTQEGLPLSVLEAQATRVPVLAAPTAGVPEVVQDGRTGFLLKASDSEGYANRIELLQDNRSLAYHLQDVAHEQVKAHHTWKAYSDKIWSLYQEVTARSGSELEPARHRSQRPARTGYTVS